jgi:hypothetical protein
MAVDAVIAAERAAADELELQPRALAQRAQAWLAARTFDEARGSTPLAEAVRSGDLGLCR